MEEKYPIGTEVYYSLEDYNTGEDIIYKGIVQNIEIKKVNLLDKEYEMKMYMLDTRMGMQCNAFYTLKELYDMAERLRYIKQIYDKDKILED